jgi:hypothetical protein
MRVRPREVLLIREHSGLVWGIFGAWSIAKEPRHCPALVLTGRFMLGEM